MGKTDPNVSVFDAMQAPAEGRARVHSRGRDGAVSCGWKRQRASAGTELPSASAGTDLLSFHSLSVLLFFDCRGTIFHSILSLQLLRAAATSEEHRRVLTGSGARSSSNQTVVTGRAVIQSLW